MSAAGRAICLLTGALRYLLGLYLVTAADGRLLVYMYGGIEIWIGLASVYGAVVAQKVETRAAGWWLVPVYWAGLFVTVDSSAPVFAIEPLAVAVLMLRAWSLVHLGAGMSVGVATWCGLADAGPYRIVRHPVQVTSILSRVAFALAVPTWWNWFGLAFMVTASVAMVILEERFLRHFCEWRAYARRVRWRLLPGVW